MQELEKILEEIEKSRKCASINGDFNVAAAHEEDMNIIRKHMNEKVTTNDLISRQALLDDFRNTITENSDTFDWLNMIARQPTVNKGDGWIPVEERMPEEPKENPEFEGKKIELYLVTVKGTKYPFRAFWNGKQFTDGWSVLDVIAWRPLPESYIPRNQNKPEDHYPEWRAKFLNKFDRRE